MLDILIPSYNCELFLKDLDEAASFIDSGKIKIIVSDDSDIEVISNKIEIFCQKNKIVYVKGPRTKNAVDNWNNLLKLSESEYFMLLHHDEMFRSISEIEKIIEYVSRFKPDVLISSLTLCGIDKKINFSNKFFKQFILRFEPEYLYIRNIIGSPSNVIFNRKFLKYEYRRDLKWLVDVDYYYRIFVNKNQQIAHNVFGVFSRQNDLSITKNTDIRFETKKEKKLLKYQYKMRYLFLDAIWSIVK